MYDTIDDYNVFLMNEPLDLVNGWGNIGITIK